MNNMVFKRFFIAVLALGFAHGQLVQTSDKRNQDDCKGKESIHCLVRFMSVGIRAERVSERRRIMKPYFQPVCPLNGLCNGQGRSDALIKVVEPHIIKKRVGRLSRKHRDFLVNIPLADELGGKTLDRFLVLLAVQRAVQECEHPAIPLIGYDLNVARITKCIIRNKATWKAIKSDVREIRDVTIERFLGTKSKKCSSSEQ